MYSSDPKVLQHYEEFSQTPQRLAERIRRDFYLKDMLDPYRISGVDSAMDEAVKGKFLQTPLSQEQLAALFQVPKP